MLADGGDDVAPHEGVRRQPELFGDIASAATVNRTIGALADRELVIEELGEVMRAARQRVKAGGVPPAVAAAANATTHNSKNRKNNEEQGWVWRLGLDIDGRRVICHNDDRDGCAGLQQRISPRLGLTRCWPIWTVVTGCGRRWQRCTARETPAQTPHQTMLRSWRWRWAVCRCCLSGWGWWCVPMLPVPPQSFWPMWVRRERSSRSGLRSLIEAIRKAIRALNDDDWVAVCRQNGQVREGAALVEITHSPWINLDDYPQGSRLVVRREPLHPGAQQTLFDIPGARFTAFLTDRPDPPAELVAYAPHAHDPLDNAVNSDALANNTLAGDRDGAAG